MTKNNVYRPFVPLIMLAAAVTAWLGFTTMQLLQDRENLRTNGQNLQAKVDAANEVRTQLQQLASGLQHLNEQGNDNARQILQRMEDQGIRLKHNPQGLPGTQPPGE